MTTTTNEDQMAQLMNTPMQSASTTSGSMPDDDLARRMALLVSRLEITNSTDSDDKLPVRDDNALDEEDLQRMLIYQTIASQPKPMEKLRRTFRELGLLTRSQPITLPEEHRILAREHQRLALDHAKQALEHERRAVPESNEVSFEQKCKEFHKTIEFNGLDLIDEDIAFATAMALSLSDADAIGLKLDHKTTYEKYIEFLSCKKFGDAFKCYSEASTKIKEFIDEQLKNVPWRISSEYQLKNGQIQWIQSWVKLGWWSKSLCEVPLHFNKGIWVSKDSKYAQFGTHSSQFNSVVWEGVGSKMIHRIVDRGDTHVNIELSKNVIDGFFVPIDVNFKIYSSKSHLDLTEVEIGCFTPGEDHNLDVLRQPMCVYTDYSGRRYLLSNGTSLGEVFITNINIPDDSDISHESIEDSADDNEI
ncbi:Hypothetical protein HVR_LOCUS1146 [uncultured virus]|nr:Hypothetical protein HVR_LOCUS1146 [uncultured virus]